MHAGTEINMKYIPIFLFQYGNYFSVDTAVTVFTEPGYIFQVKSDVSLRAQQRSKSPPKFFRETTSKMIKITEPEALKCKLFCI